RGRNWRGRWRCELQDRRVDAAALGVVAAAAEEAGERRAGGRNLRGVLERRGRGGPAVAAVRAVLVDRGLTAHADEDAADDRRDGRTAGGRPGEAGADGIDAAALRVAAVAAVAGGGEVTGWGDVIVALCKVDDIAASVSAVAG